MLNQRIILDSVSWGRRWMIDFRLSLGNSTQFGFKNNAERAYAIYQTFQTASSPFERKLAALQSISGIENSNTRERLYPLGFEWIREGMGVRTFNLEKILQTLEPSQADPFVKACLNASSWPQRFLTLHYIFEREAFYNSSEWFFEYSIAMRSFLRQSEFRSELIQMLLKLDQQLLRQFIFECFQNGNQSLVESIDPLISQLPNSRKLYVLVLDYAQINDLHSLMLIKKYLESLPAEYAARLQDYVAQINLRIRTFQ